MITDAQVKPPTNSNQQQKGAAALQIPKSVNKDTNNNNTIHPSTNTSQPLTIHIPQGNPVGHTPAAAAIKTTDMSSNPSVSSFQDNITAVVSTETDCSDVHEHTNNNNTPTPKLCEQKNTDDSAPDIELDAAETLLNIGSSSKPSRSSSNQNSPMELAAQTQRRTQNITSSATHTTSQESPNYNQIQHMNQLPQPPVYTQHPPSFWQGFEFAKYLFSTGQYNAFMQQQHASNNHSAVVPLLPASSTNPSTSHHQQQPIQEMQIDVQGQQQLGGTNSSAVPVPVPSINLEKEYQGKVLLALPEDKDVLNPLRCFLRKNICAFTATQLDISCSPTSAKKSRLGQVGLGCIHCLTLPPNQRIKRSVCFPFNISRIYQSVADIQRFHFNECSMMPSDTRAEFTKLQGDSLKGSAGVSTKTYWVDSAKRLGLADGPNGMYFRRDPSLPPPLDLKSLTNVDYKGVELVAKEDMGTVAHLLIVSMGQLQPCEFGDTDQNKRRIIEVGTKGVCCKHCTGTHNERKFFWSSISALESNFVSVHTHLMKCKHVPQEVKAMIERTKEVRKEETNALKPGSQKRFFIRVWARLHGNPVPITPSPQEAKKKNKRKRQSSKAIKKEATVSVVVGGSKMDEKCTAKMEAV